ncbi:hypothetical protein [Geodermatophilus telluris]|nr:hypothetical protein [Geodermatophilus telluris]
MVTDPPQDSAHTTGPDVPPGPWRWIRLDPGRVYDRRTPAQDAALGLDAGLRQPAGERGWGLIDAGGDAVLSVDGGWGSPELAGGAAFSPDHPVAQLLARASEIPTLDAALAEARTLLTDREELRALVRRQAAEVALLEAQQDESGVRFRHLEDTNEALVAQLAAAHARIEQLTAARAEAVKWAQLLADTFGLPARTGLGPPPAWLLAAPEQP